MGTHQIWDYIRMYGDMGHTEDIWKYLGRHTDMALCRDFLRIYEDTWGLHSVKGGICRFESLDLLF